MKSTKLSRRELLLAGSALLVGCDASQPQQGFLGVMDRFTNRAEQTLFRPEKRAPELDAAELTPLEAFPQYKIGDVFPAVPAGWALEVSGMVARPLHLSLADLQKLPRTEMRVRHHCVEGWSAVGSWHGVRVSELARLASPDPAARFVEFVSFEAAPETPGVTYTSSWDLASALHAQSLVAYGMDGAPLGIEHGGPARLYSAVKLGYKSVKWLAAVRFLPKMTGGYWEDQGYEWFAGV